MQIDDKIRAHYSTHYKDQGNAGDDHLHIGGKEATALLAKKMMLKPGQTMLDIGCGLGGPARFFADSFDVQVTGVDLSPDYISAARAKNPHIRFDVGSALTLPYEDRTFDAAVMIHVGMNIPDKKGLYAEAFRVLKVGGYLAVYDVMAGTGEEDFFYPVPWSQTAETSFLETPQAMKTYIKNAGFQIISHEDRQKYALSSLQNVLSHPKLDAGRRRVVENLYANIESSLCSPVILICEKALPVL